ncbi:hypothetical protein MSAN_02381100 [Mycena sanguinolenta]|uniref:Uncharacterized protein n=1 Tax=Mycena sanguinolenta TaxID=230812 RepID=A0A8H7CG33_9AGAR|nr:hypothetical protein MSAN_02381100 [Mycena sanguinolenta]
MPHHSEPATTPVLVGLGTHVVVPPSPSLRKKRESLEWKGSSFVLVDPEEDADVELLGVHDLRSDLRPGLHAEPRGQEGEDVVVEEAEAALLGMVKTTSSAAAILEQIRKPPRPVADSSNDFFKVVFSAIIWAAISPADHQSRSSTRLARRSRRDTPFPGLHTDVIEIARTHEAHRSSEATMHIRRAAPRVRPASHPCSPLNEGARMSTHSPDMYYLWPHIHPSRALTHEHPSALGRTHGGLAFAAAGKHGASRLKNFVP